MKAYYVRQRVSPSGFEKEVSEPFAPGNPFEVLDRTYATADLSDVKNSAELIFKINNPANPVCIAMMVEELREIVNKGPEGRREDMGRFLSSLKEDNLVALEPYGSDIDRSKQNREYLPDLALSGKDFPEIVNERIVPLLFAKTAKREKGKAVGDFPKRFTDTKECDDYLFGNVDEAARKIAQEKGIEDEERIAGISLELNQLYTRYPEVALAKIRDVIEGEEREEKIVTICPHGEHLKLILQRLKDS